MKYILYHGHCYDGFGAAYAAWKKFGDANTKYIAVHYGSPVPPIPNAEDVYLVDFCFPETELRELADNCERLHIIDHHKTAIPLIDSIEHSNIRTRITDQSKSGALLTWEHLHGALSAPLLIHHISDRDLWKFEMEGTKEVHAALVATPMDFEVWDKYANSVEGLKARGAICLDQTNAMVKSTVEKSWLQKIDDHLVPVVNTSIAWSEIGQALLRKHPNAPFAASFTVMKNKIMWSLRSREDFDVSEVAKKFGGGGHKCAAGFVTPRV